MVLEANLTETRDGIEASHSMGRVWETQLANIEKEVARLICETNQLKDCNAALHNQVGRRERLRHQGVRIRKRTAISDAHFCPCLYMIFLSYNL